MTSQIIKIVTEDTIQRAKNMRDIYRGLYRNPSLVNAAESYGKFVINAAVPGIVSKQIFGAIDTAKPFIVKGAQKIGSNVNNFLHRKKKQQNRLVAKGLQKKKIKNA